VVGIAYNINSNNYNRKNRLTTGWNFIRIAFTVLGLFMLIQSIFDKEYLSSILGGYLAIMGLFGIGCASGSCCATGTCSSSKKTEITNEKDVFYQEIK
jgi:hypothetical protein